MLNSNLISNNHLIFGLVLIASYILYIHKYNMYGTTGADTEPYVPGRTFSQITSNAAHAAHMCQHRNTRADTHTMHGICVFVRRVRAQKR